MTVKLTTSVMTQCYEAYHHTKAFFINLSHTLTDAQSCEPDNEIHMDLWSPWVFLTFICTSTDCHLTFPGTQRLLSVFIRKMLHLVTLYWMWLENQFDHQSSTRQSRGRWTESNSHPHRKRALYKWKVDSLILICKWDTEMLSGEAERGDAWAKLSHLHQTHSGETWQV